MNAASASKNSRISKKAMQLRLSSSKKLCPSDFGMVIGFLSLEIYLPYSHSLKEKRKTIVSFKDRVKKKFNVAIAELDYHDKWQRSKIGIVTLNNRKMMVESIFQKILTEAEENIEGEIIKTAIHFF